MAQIIITYVDRNGEPYHTESYQGRKMPDKWKRIHQTKDDYYWVRPQQGQKGFWVVDCETPCLAGDYRYSEDSSPYRLRIRIV